MVGLVAHGLFLEPDVHALKGTGTAVGLLDGLQGMRGGSSNLDVIVPQHCSSLGFHVLTLTDHVRCETSCIQWTPHPVTAQYDRAKLLTGSRPLMPTGVSGWGSWCDIC